MARPETHTPDIPTDPYPIDGTSSIISGFGRGSSELGIPTANIPINESLNNLPTGIYFGWCKIVPDRSAEISKHQRNDGHSIIFNNGLNLVEGELCVFPMVMSIGWNPFYNNKEKAAEVHIMHEFNDTFYGASIKYSVLGYIRPELNYTTKGMYNYFEFDSNLRYVIWVIAESRKIYLSSGFSLINQ